MFMGRTDEDCVKYFKNPNNKAMTDRIIKDINNAVTESETMDISNEVSNEVSNETVTTGDTPKPKK